MTQNLSPTARRMKAIRDKRMAMTTDRKAKKAENQRKRRANPAAAKDKDYDHKTSTFKTVKANRGNDGKGTKVESGKKYKVDSPVKKVNKELIKQASEMRAKSKEIEDKFLLDYKPVKSKKGKKFNVKLKRKPKYKVVVGKPVPIGVKVKKKITSPKIVNIKPMTELSQMKLKKKQKNN